MPTYLIRLDDACPTMDHKKWNKIFDILDKYDIKPIVAVIPNNADKNMIIDHYNNNFWNNVKKWQRRGYHIAMHGYDHNYISENSGLIPMNNKSEFAGVDKNIQIKKIQHGWKIFKKNGISPKIWVAPSHTFDKNTLRVLKKETDIYIISDGVACYPYSKYNFFWVPQQLWWFEEKKDGVWTVCLHPNNINEEQIKKLENILKNNINNFKVDLDVLYKRYKNRPLSIKDNFYFNFFFLRRKLSKIKILKLIYKNIKGLKN